MQTGTDTPDALELRKRRIEDAMEEDGSEQALYKVISQKQTGITAGAAMGSTHLYDVAGATATSIELSKKNPIEG